MMTSSNRTLRILWSSEVPDAVREVAEWCVRDYAPLLPESVDALVLHFLAEESVEPLPGRCTPMAFVSDSDQGVGITIMLDIKAFHPVWLQSAILRAILDLTFDERPENWWPALSYLLARTDPHKDYLLPPSGITGVEQIYRRVMREQLGHVLDLLATEIEMLRGDHVFAPLWTRKGASPGARVAAMMEYRFNPVEEAGPDFLDWLDEKGWGHLAEQWVEEQRRQRG